MQQKYRECVSGVTFIREASKCVLTRNNNPLHIVKNFAVVSVQADAPGKGVHTLSMKSILLEVPDQGLVLMVDGPANGIQSIWKELNAASIQDHCGNVVDWHLQRRSRANTAERPRSVLVGRTKTISDLVILAMIQRIRETLGMGWDCVVGHTGMFSDKQLIIVEGSLPQILYLQDHVTACVTVAPTNVTPI